MREIGPEHSFSYREEVLKPIFKLVQSAESCHVIAAASIGKTRLIDFMMRADVQENYLQEHAKNTLLIRVDLNRLDAMNDTGFYELLMNAIVSSCGQKPELSELQQEFARILSEVLLRNDLPSLRFVELFIQRLCQDTNLKLVIIFDEFDIAYKELPSKIFANLRAIRDANKNRLCYILFLRNQLEKLRAPNENESFYELVSRNLIGLGPYNHKDSLIIVEQLEARRQYQLTEEQREWIVQMSGGHPGLMQALLSVIINLPNLKDPLTNLRSLVRQEAVEEECRKIWDSLPGDEQKGLITFVRTNSVPQQVLKRLSAKGMLQKKEKSYKIFSPLFDIYLQDKAKTAK
jgi:hypothetical protein